MAYRPAPHALVNCDIALLIALLQDTPSTDALDYADCTLEEAGLEEHNYDTVTAAQMRYYDDEA